MKEFLKKIGLFDELTITLEVDRFDFVKFLKEKVDKPQPDFFDFFSKSRNKYKGIVDYEWFKLKRRRKYLDTGLNSAKVRGTITQAEDEKLILELEIYSWSFPVLAVFMLAIILYIILLAIVVSNPVYSKGVVGMILFHASVMLMLPYFMMRQSLRRMKKEIEKDIVAMAKSAR